MSQVVAFQRGPSETALKNQPVLECRNLSRSFMLGKSLFSAGAKLRAVDNVDIAVGRGEVLAIVGESGSGKTTLGRMLLGILSPTEGEIRLNGEPIGGFLPRELAQRIQPVFQDPYSSLNPRKNVAQIIALPLDVQGVGNREERRRRVEEMMERVGLPRRLLYTYPSQLSGGQRQRVAIARALIVRPEIVVLDEPTSALDVSVQAQILNLLQDLREQLNLTYVFISHDLAVVEHMADQVAVMYLGRIVEYGPARRVLQQPRHPYAQALLRSVLTPEPGLGLPDLGLGRGFPNPLAPPSGCCFHPRCPDAMAQCQTVTPKAVRDVDGFVECHLYDNASS